MGTQTMIRLKKAMAILLLVLFLVSLTAVAASAKTAETCKEPKPDCGYGKAACTNGHWKCECIGHKLMCKEGLHAVCDKANWRWRCIP